MTTTTTEKLQPLDDGLAFEFQLVAEPRLHVRARFQQQRYWDPSHKTRCHVTLDDGDVPMDTPPYGSMRGDGSPEDKLWTRYNRLEVREMRAKLNRAMLVLSAADGHGGGPWAFSRKAGCSCGCSPGFTYEAKILYMTGDGYARPVDMWVW